MENPNITIIEIRQVGTESYPNRVEAKGKITAHPDYLSADFTVILSEKEMELLGLLETEIIARVRKSLAEH